MTHKKTLLFSLIPFAALLLMAASGNLRWDQFRAADKHGTGSYGQSSDGTGTSGDVAAFNANGGLTDGGPAGALLSGAANPGIPVIPSVRQAGATGSHVATGGTITQAFTSGVVSGNGVIVTGSCNNNPLSTVSDTLGTTYTKILGATNSSQAAFLGILASSGADTVTLTASAGWCGDMSVGIAEIANTNGVVDVTALTSGATSGPAAVVTTKYGDLLVLSTVDYNTTATFTATSPSAIDTSTTADNQSVFIGHLVTAAAGTYTPSVSNSGGNITNYTIALEPIPVTSPGITGSFYINTSTGVLWGPKTSSGWNPSGDSVIPESSPPSTVRGLTFTFDGGGSALSAGKVVYLRAPFACTIVSWSIASTTAETDTVALWRVATGGTALPTSSNSISTAGVSLTSGTAIYSTNLTDFTSTAIAANDWLAASITAVAASRFVSYTLGCQQ